MAESRVAKSLRNTIFGVIGIFCNLIVSFIAKSIFIKLLGAEYNGVNGLFSNILQVLNLAELGFASSIAYALYKPLKEGDYETVARLMNYFARIYRLIALVVIAAGCCCIPILQYLIAEDISDLPFTLNQLRSYFALYLVNTAASYLLAYKRTILTADQNNYIISIIDSVCNVMLNVLQIVLLLIYKNYYAFLIVMIAKTVINNLIIHIIASKKYKYLSQYKKLKLGKEQKSEVFKNVQAMFLHRIGTVVINGTTSIIISAFVSIVDAGMYGNYLMIVVNINNFINIIFTSITASVGNLCVGADKEYQYLMFRRIQYISAFFAVFTFACYVCLFNDFITIWLGKDMLFGLAVVVAISLSAMSGYVRKTVQMFKDAMGLFKKDWYKPLIEAGLGIVLAIGLSYVWGTFGVIIGYTSASIIVAIPIENYVLFKYGLKRKVGRQIVELTITILFAFALTALMYWICSYIPVGIGWFLLKMIFAVIFAAGAFVAATCWTPEFKYYVGIAKRMINVIKAKIKKTPINSVTTEDENSSEIKNETTENKKED